MQPATSNQHKFLIPLLFVSSLIFTLSAQAENAPAVSAINAKIEAQGGSVDSGSSDGLAASLAFPSLIKPAFMPSGEHRIKTCSDLPGYTLNRPTSA